MQTDPRMFHLKCLLEGAVFKELQETEMAVQCLKEMLARHQGKREDGINTIIIIMIIIMIMIIIIIIIIIIIMCALLLLLSLSLSVCQCLKETLARHQGKREDGHVATFALFELAAIYMKTPETKQMAKEHLQLIKDSYKDYDFENRLSVRVNNALKQLKRDSATSL
ncbi:hypothetical protein ACOMHN_034387 [Nucella lapillus]